MAKKSIHTGLRAYRLSDDGPSTSREKALAELWQQNQENDLLAYLLGSDNHKGEVSERDAQVAATIIQWLGTNVGQAFLAEARVTAELQKV